MTLLTSWTPAGTPADPYLPASAAVPGGMTPRTDPSSAQAKTQAHAQTPAPAPATEAGGAPDTGATASIDTGRPPADTPQAVPGGPIAPAASVAVQAEAKTQPPVTPRVTTPVVAPGRLAGPGRSRAQRRAARKAAQAQARRTQLAGVAKFAVPALVLIALIAAGSALLGRGGDQPEAAAVDGRTQQTLLLQVTGDSGLALNTVLLGRATQGEATAGLLIPSRLLTQAPGAGSITIGETGRLPDPAVAAAAVSDQFGVLVDGTWRLNPAGLAAVIDAVGGIDVLVDRDVVDAQGTIVLAAGQQTLGGVAAAQYALYRASGEQEQSRAARFGDVLTAVLAAAPSDAAGLTAAVQAAGGNAVATRTPEEVGGFLVPLASAARTDGIGLSSAPVEPIDTGSSDVSFRLDATAAKQAVRTAFAGSLPTSTQSSLRVLVQNGVGAPGLGQAARGKLVAAGLTYVSGGNARAFGRDASIVVVADSTPASREAGRTVARALGLPETAVKISDRGQSVADVVVVLGKDFVGA